MVDSLNPKQHNPAFSTHAQITPEQVPAIAAAGYKTIINNRPDGEGGPEQPSSAAIAKACAEAGVQYHFLPVVSGQYGEEQVAQMAQLLDTAAQPVFCFCRSGGRSTQLYTLAQQLQSKP